MAFLLVCFHLAASVSASFDLSACSRVAERLMFSALVFFSKSLFMLKFVGFLGASWLYSVSITLSFMRISMRIVMHLTRPSNRTCVSLFGLRMALP